MRESVSRRKPRTNFLKLSIRRRLREWESGCRSAAGSSRDIMAVFGPSRMPGQVQPSRFPFLAVQGTQPARRHSEKSLTRLAEQVDSRVLCAPRKPGRTSLTKICTLWRHQRLAAIEYDLLPSSVLARLIYQCESCFWGAPRP